MSQRTYDDACGAARAMDVIGERWALLVVRELIFGPKRFRDLRDGLPKASQNVLSQRLRDLETSGVVTRVELGPPASTHAYALTERGRQLEPVLIALSRWGAHVPAPDEAEMSIDAFMLMLKALYQAPDDQRSTLSVGIDVGADSFTVNTTPDSIDITRATNPDAQVTMRADVGTLRQLTFGEVSADAAVKSGHADIQGPLKLAQQFFRYFEMPALAGLAV
ncbi:transcriptional regulator [Streptomyces sp. SID14446]|uniref:winged helix-turn-helix transcriptional regulator n=1 Tax=unclassified Streptomyces TaxID=2593676 RepID=UPI0013B8C81B|nr:winged helix-turn-helix transcriptional regulator [Streptomyces sp. SID14446]NEB32890.1 transcriptional regulator [Streptomyces sp. SID14446]